MNYTKGEWSIYPSAVAIKDLSIWCEGQYIATVQANANAHLIAASPLVYEALIAVYQDIELQNVKGGSDELNIMVQQAIAKVKEAK